MTPTYQRIKLSLFSTLLCGFLAHAYCYFNLFFSHDSVMVSQQMDWYWQISIGRWFQPFYGLLRGNIYNPFLVGILSLLFLSLACYLILVLLNIHSRLGIFCTCGVLATNCMLTYANATYIHSSDIYMLALLFAVAGVYVYEARKWGFALSVILFAFSLGLYQSFLQVAILLFMFLIIQDILDNKDVVSVIKKGLGYVFTLIASVILYYVAYKVILLQTGLSATNSYNSASGLLELNGLGDIFSLIIGAYKYFFNYWLHPSVYNEKLISVLTILLFAYTAYALAHIAIKKRVRPSNIVLLVLCYVLLPLGGNMIFVLTKGMEHDLMIFSFFVLIVWAICLQTYKTNMASPSTTTKAVPRCSLDAIIVFGVCGVFILNSIIFANQLYLKKDLEFQKTYATLNRVINRIEQIDGYVANQTPVALIGSLEDSSLAKKDPSFSYTGPGQGSMFAVTYYSTYETFLENVMGYPIQILDQASSDTFKENPVVQEMPTFPDRESCQMVDGTVVVKLSDIDP